MKISFTKKEIGSLVVSALVLGLVFGFDDGREVFAPRLWLANYMLMSCLGLIAVIVMILGQKWAAARYNVSAEYSLWGISRFGFKAYQHLPKHAPLKRIPLGIILPVLVAIFTEGKIWFAAVGMMTTAAKVEHRIGKKFIHIADYEEARIAFAGPIALIMVMSLFGLVMESTGLEIMRKMIIILMAVLLSNLIPFPHLPGGRMLFTSFYLFVFAMALAAIMSLLLLFAPTTLALISALILSVGTTALVFFKREV